MIDLSINIVTYNNEEEILPLLESIYKFTSDIAFQIYVVDNVSSDNTVSLVKSSFPQVSVIESSTNNGFGHGHNQVLPLIDSRYHAIVNPDIRLTENSLKTLVDYLDANPNCVIVTPKIMNDDGTEQHLPKKKPKAKYLFGGRLEKYGEFFARLRREYTLADKDIKEPIEIQFCTGCFMVIRTEIFKKLNGFDERFFMYFEDADLTDRAGEYGKVIFNPLTFVIHKWERASSKNLKFLKIQLQSYFKYLIK